MTEPPVVHVSYGVPDVALRYRKNGVVVADGTGGFFLYNAGYWEPVYRLIQGWLFDGMEAV